MDAATPACNVSASILTHNAENVIPSGEKGKLKTSSCVSGIQLALVTDKDRAFW